jgi:hypothetical protein
MLLCDFKGLGKFGTFGGSFDINGLEKRPNVRGGFALAFSLGKAVISGAGVLPDCAISSAIRVAV